MRIGTQLTLWVWTGKAGCDAAKAVVATTLRLIFREKTSDQFKYPTSDQFKYPTLMLISPHSHPSGPALPSRRTSPARRLWMTSSPPPHHSLPSRRTLPARRLWMTSSSPAVRRSPPISSATWSQCPPPSRCVNEASHLPLMQQCYRC